MSIVNWSAIPEANIYPEGYHSFLNVYHPNRINCNPLYYTPSGQLDHEIWSHYFTTNTSRILRTEAISHYTNLPKPASADKLAWPTSSHRWYAYTPASGLSLDPRVDPNVIQAFQLCPELQGGSYCLDPAYSAKTVTKSINTQLPPSHFNRLKRKYKFTWHEQRHNPSPNYNFNDR